MEQANKAEETEKQEAEIVVTLDDLIPQEASFTLSTRDGFEFNLRRITLEDRQWIRAHYGEEKIKEHFSNFDLVAIYPLIYRLLDQDGRRQFPAQKRDAYLDEDGIEQEGRMLKGYEVMGLAINTPQDEVNVWQALFKVIGTSNPMLEKVFDDVKKKMNEKLRADQVRILKKKQNPTGE